MASGDTDHYYYGAEASEAYEENDVAFFDNNVEKDSPFIAPKTTTFAATKSAAKTNCSVSVGESKAAVAIKKKKKPTEGEQGVKTTASLERATAAATAVAAGLAEEANTTANLDRKDGKSKTSSKSVGNGSTSGSGSGVGPKTSKSREILLRKQPERGESSFRDDVLVGINSAASASADGADSNDPTTSSPPTADPRTRETSSRETSSPAYGGITTTSGLAVGLSDDSLISMLGQPPKAVPSLRTKSGFQEFFRGVSEERMKRLLRAAYSGLNELERENKVMKRMQLLGDVLIVD
jgi:hypothetical protein